MRVWVMYVYDVAMGHWREQGPNLWPIFLSMPWILVCEWNSKSSSNTTTPNAKLIASCKFHSKYNLQQVEHWVELIQTLSGTCCKFRWVELMRILGVQACLHSTILLIEGLQTHNPLPTHLSSLIKLHFIEFIFALTNSHKPRYKKTFTNLTPSMNINLYMEI